MSVQKTRTDSIPDEVLGFVLSFLSLEHIHSCSLTCTRWSTLCWKYQRRLDLNKYKGTCTDTVLEWLRANSPELEWLSLNSCSRFTQKSANFVSTFLHLEYLDLSHCGSVNDEFLRVLGQKSACLKRLKLDYCLGIFGIGFSSLPSLQLTELSIKGATFCSNAFLSSSISAFTSLTSLDIAGARPIPAFFQFISQLTSLTSLNISDTKITSEGFFELSTLSSLKLLNVSKNPNLTDEFWEQLQFYPNLEELNLSQNNGVFSEFSALGGSVFLESLSRLKSLNLSRLRSIPSHWLSHSKHPSLTSLNLDNTSLSGVFHNFQKSFPKLEELRVKTCDVTDLDTQNFAGISTLKVLDLSFCTRISNKTLANLKNHPGLEKLFMHCLPEVTDDGFNYLSDIPNLHVLDLGGCNVTDEGVFILSKMVKLRELALASCHAITKASLPHIIGCNHLSHIDLRFCPAFLGKPERNMLKDMLGKKVFL